MCKIKVNKTDINNITTPEIKKIIPESVIFSIGYEPILKIDISIGFGFSLQ